MQAEIVFSSGRTIRPVRFVLVDGVPTKIKRCAFCREDFPVDRFQVLGRDAAGEPREWHPRCKTCDRPFLAAYRKQNRQRIRARARISERKTRARRKREQAGFATERPVELGAMDHRGGGYAPREPFRTWLIAYKAAEHLVDDTALAHHLGLVDRRVRSLVQEEQPTVAFDTIDRALTNAARIIELDGKPIIGFDDLYPNWHPPTRPKTEKGRA